MPRLTTSLRVFRVLRVFALASFGAVALSSAACHRVVVDDVHGPDGNHWKRLSCRHMDKRCYREAAQLCPNGYYFAKTVPPSIAEHDTSDDVMEAAAAKQHTVSPAPQAGVNAKTLPPQETWSNGMYSSKAGTILVQCASEKTASR